MFIIDSLCEKNNFCFKCINDYNCIWNSGKCEDSKNESNKYNILDIQTSELKTCFEARDSQTALFVKTYCGDIKYEFKKKSKDPLKISLPKNGNLYGANALYCEYTIENNEEIKSLQIQATKKWGTLYMKIEYEEMEEDSEFILDNEQKYIINKPKTIKIIFQSNEAKGNSPFFVIISNALTPLNIAIIVLIIFGLFVVIIIFILLIVYFRKQRRRNTAIIINNNGNIFIDINNQGYSTERIGIMNYINNRKSIKFKQIRDKSINNICPIEMTPFEDNSDVIFTSCHHSFHYECIKRYIASNNNLKEFRCFFDHTILYKNNESLNSNVNKF